VIDDGRQGPMQARQARFEDGGIEDLLGGRVLAWVGGGAVLLGVAFFLAIAVSHGWLGEPARCLLAGAGALGLLAAGVRRRERGGPSDAAVAAAAAAIGALEVDVAVAARTYHLLPAASGVVLALLAGATGTALAIRWRSQVIGALGLLGALLAPALAGAPYDGGTLILLFACAVPVTAVLVVQRWDALVLAAYAVLAPQVALCVVSSTVGLGAAIAALVAFAALVTAQAVGFEIRTKSPELRPVSAFLLAVDALVLAAGGWALLQAAALDTAAGLWLAGLAVAHAAAGLGGGRTARVSRELSLVALTLAVMLADVAFAALAGGVALPVGYALGAIGFVALARALPDRLADRFLVRAGLGGHVLLAAGHALVLDAPANALFDGKLDTGAAVLALASVAAASFAGARSPALPREMRGALDGLALAAIAWLGALTLPAAALAIAWAGEAAALAAVARRTRDGVAAGGAWAHLAGAAAIVLIDLAPPTALYDGLHAPLEAAGALAALTLALARCGRSDMAGEPRRGLLATVAAAAALYTASALLVTVVGHPQQGQMALTALWAATGVAAVLAGLRGRAALRRGGLGLLGIAIGKLFVVDLATLASVYRAASFIAVGLLLLAAALAWQRQRPRAYAT
jgi:Predicted membrane protein (DUF2339)